MTGPSAGGARRMMHQDRSVLEKKLAPGTLRRVVSFAEPYRRELAIFLLLTIVSSVIGVATPLLAGDVINEISANGAVKVVLTLAAVIAGLAVLDALLSLGTRWYSSRIGEGLIFDMRTKVFQHVQQMSLAFFTRTQTGALVSRLNNDVIGAQQAFTSTLSGVVSNVIGLILTAIVMFTLSWQVTVLSLILLPIFVLPAKRFGRKLQTLTRESYGLNASMNTTTTERFNVSGALLVVLFGRPEVEAQSFSDRAGRVRDIGVTTAMYGRVFIVALGLVAALAQALTYGLGGTLALNGSMEPGAVVSLALLLSRLYGPLTALSNVRVDVMSALVSFERVFEVLDLKPLIIEKPDAAVLPPGRQSVEFTDVHFAYPGADEVSLASLEDVAVPDHSPRHPVLHGVSFRAGAGQLVALVGPSALGKPQSRNWFHGCTTWTPAACGSAALMSGTSPCSRCGMRSASSRRTPTCSTTRSGPTCSTRGRTRRRRTSSRRCGLRRSGTWCPGCRRAWTPSSATAGIGSPAARSSDSPSPGCCSRRRPS